MNDSSKKTTRREWMKAAGLVIVGSSFYCTKTGKFIGELDEYNEEIDDAPQELAGADTADAGEETLLVNGIPARKLGATDMVATIFGLGGQAALEMSNNKETAVKIIERAVEIGVNYFDTSHYYGPSRDYLGEGLDGSRDKIFLASKTMNRTYDGSMKIIEETLQKLRTDHLDLLQIHNLVYIHELDDIFGENGAMKALIKAKEEGMTRYLGVTGHYDPDALVEALNRFPFDTVLMPVNAADRINNPFLEKTLPKALEKNCGVIGMKCTSRGVIFSEKLGIKEALDYVWTQQVHTAIVGCDSVAQLEENVKLAKEFKPLTAGELKAIEAVVEPYAQPASFFKKWT